jgi:hypothetical protein
MPKTLEIGRCDDSAPIRSACPATRNNNDQDPNACLGWMRQVRALSNWSNFAKRRIVEVKSGAMALQPT